MQVRYRKIYTHNELKNVDNRHAGKTAWIVGSGVSLDSNCKWEIPKGVVTFALNGGVVWFWNKKRNIKKSGMIDIDCYQRPLNYWLCFDKRVSSVTMQPEFDYWNIAMRHPKAIKLLPEYISQPSDIDRNLVYLMALQNKNTLFYKPFKGYLITGNSVLTPCLHYCYMAGFKRVILSGIDMCLMKVEDVYQRYYSGLRSMKWKGSHIKGGGRFIIAPNGETVSIGSMYELHRCQVMAQIRFLQSKGIEVLKTSDRGMIDVPAIVTEKDLYAIIKK